MRVYQFRHIRRGGDDIARRRRRDARRPLRPALGPAPAPAHDRAFARLVAPFAPLSSRGLGRRPLTAETGVRIPVAVSLAQGRLPHVLGHGVRRLERSPCAGTDARSARCPGSPPGIPGQPARSGSRPRRTATPRQPARRCISTTPYRHATTSPPSAARARPVTPLRTSSAARPARRGAVRVGRVESRPPLGEHGGPLAAASLQMVRWRCMRGPGRVRIPAPRRPVR